MKAVILAGGFGTRLGDICKDIPKPMVSIAGKPFLEHQINFLKENGITEIILAVHHMADYIKSYFGTGLRWEVNITYSEEEEPLGTAGAIKNAEKYINNTFLVLNGDSYSDVEIKKLIEFHKNKNSIATICLIPEKDSSHYGNVILKENKITGFFEKDKGGEGLINTGVYVFEPAIFRYIESNKKVSIEKEIFPNLVREDILWGYEHKGYFMDIGRPETYEKFKMDFLEELYLTENASVRDALEKITKSEINLVLIVDENKRLLGVITDRIIKKFLLNGGELKEKISSAMIKEPITARINEGESKISELLLAGIKSLPILDNEGKVLDVQFRKERIYTENFPVLRGKVPLRISFAGGGTDIPYFFEKYGGIVINSTINKYCHATVIKRADTKICITSDLGDELIIDSKEHITYDGKFDLIKAIIKLMDLNFGIELYLHNDLPPGRGLGSSASLAVLMVKSLSYLQGKRYDDYKIAEIAHRAEIEELKIKGGWQDQYAAVTGGFSFMEFGKDKSIIYPLKLKEEVINELNHHMMLCYVGNTHFSGNIHENQELKFQRGEEEIVQIQNEHKEIAINIKDALLTNNLRKIGELLHKSWENKRKLSPNIANPKIDNLYETGLKNGALGGRLLGAGGGGYILFYYSPKKRNQLKKAIEKNGGEIMDFSFESRGVQIWNVQNNL